nr:linear gramicidin synthase subunit B [uncultured bacterium]
MIAGDDCLHDLVSRQAARTPGAVALVCRGERITYADLDARATRLADELRALGVGPEVRVALYLDRSPLLVVGILGVLKAGGAYVPLDPAYPRERIEFILADAGAPLVLTRQALLDRVPSGSGRTLALDGDRPDGSSIAGPRSPSAPPRAADPDNLAYLIYTSGSTGRAKGVAIAHRSAVALLRWVYQTYSPADLAGVLFSTSVCFDLSIFELFAPLCCGGAVVLCENLLHFPSLPAPAEVTLINTVPSAMTALLRLGDLPATVRVVNLAGEPLPQRLVEAVYRQSAAHSVWNLYGPSEDTTYSTAASIPRAVPDVPPIGAPIPGTEAWVLDGEMRPVRHGEVGELYLGGAGLSRGYLDRPGLTADRYLPDPFGEPGARLYRTGDRVRWLPDGKLEYLGRVDHQVKLRGFRIELGEIEATLGRHADVRAAAAVVSPGADGEPRLVAYLEGEGRRAVDVAAVRAWLREKLPEHMIPAAWVVMDALPLNPSGKVDRRALPPPEAAAPTEVDEPAAPRTPTEAALLAMWQDVLGATRVGVTDRFFDLGGHSLMATRLVARIRERLGVDVPLRAIFDDPTIEKLAAAIDTSPQSSTASTAAGGSAAAIPAARRSERPRLSSVQRRLWFLDQLESPRGSALYNIPAALRMHGPLDPGALERAFTRVVARHEALRTTFVVGDDGEPWQAIAPPAPVPLPIVDLSMLPAAEREAEALRLSLADARCPFDLAQGPLLRATLLRLDEGDHLLSLQVHHIASDDWSQWVMFRELSELYRADVAGQAPSLEAPSLSYAEFSEAQGRRLGGAAFDTMLAAWKRRLDGAPPLLPLPTDRPRPAAQRHLGAQLGFSLPSSLVNALEALARGAGVTLYMTALAAFQALLARYSGQDDIVVGSPIAGRTQRGTEAMIGFFVNTLAMRTDLSGNPTFRELLGRVRDVALEAYESQDLPFERVVEAVRPERSLGHGPIVQVMFALQNAPTAVLALPGISVAPVDLHNGTAKFDLTVTLEAEGEALRGRVEYDSDLFDEDRVARLAGHYRALLESVAADPEQPIASVPLLTAAERARVLVEWNDTHAPVATDRLVHELVAERAAASPDAIAVVAGDLALTYAELDGRAARLGRRLRALGVGPDAMVAVMMDRRPELVVGLLGVLKAGGAYVPLDPGQPRERTAWMLGDTRARVIVTRAQLRDRLPESAARIVLVDEEDADGGDDTAARIGSAPLPSSLAYVIYTSGSTGRPKGVAVQHDSLLNLVAWHRDRYRLAPGDRASQIASVTFDAAVWELWPNLAAGATVVLADEEVRLDPRRLVDWLVAERINVAFLPTPLAEAALASPWPAGGSLRALLTGGDALRAASYPRLPFELVNHYGPTESTVVTTCATVPTGVAAPGAPPIGRPIANTRVYVLDAARNPVPIGVAGELYVGGAGLARGYLHRPDLTAERFVGDPFAAGSGQRLYRTGDVVRFRADGALEFLGRNDDQMKLRGFRIEPGEIEGCLREHAQVQDAVALLREDAPGDRRLVAYVVPRGGAVDAGALRGHLAARLPEYMVPQAIVALDALPLTSSGKVDRRALPPPPDASASDDTASGAPQDPVEDVLAGLWREVLRVDRVGRSDHFFRLGGHSLTASQVVSRVRRVFRAEVSVRSLFEHPTPAAYARYLVAHEGQPGLTDRIARVVQRHRRGLADRTAPVDGA